MEMKFFSKMLRLALSPTQGIRGLFPREQSGRVVKLTTVEQKNAWSYTSIPHTPSWRLPGAILT